MTPAATELAAQTVAKRPWCNHTESALVTILRRHGKHAAISAQELGAQIQRNPRNVRAMIAHIRAEHQVPICSVSAHRDGEPTGFFYPANAEEALPTLAQLGSRRAEIQAAMDGIAEGVRREWGQMSLWGDRAA